MIHRKGISLYLIERYQMKIHPIQIHQTGQHPISVFYCEESSYIYIKQGGELLQDRVSLERMIGGDVEDIGQSMVVKDHGHCQELANPELIESTLLLIAIVVLVEQLIEQLRSTTRQCEIDFVMRAFENKVSIKLHPEQILLSNFIDSSPVHVIGEGEVDQKLLMIAYNLFIQLHNVEEELERCIKILDIEIPYEAEVNSELVEKAEVKDSMNCI